MQAVLFALLAASGAVDRVCCLVCCKQALTLLATGPVLITITYGWIWEVVLCQLSLLMSCMHDSPEIFDSSTCMFDIVVPFAVPSQLFAFVIYIC